MHSYSRIFDFVTSGYCHLLLETISLFDTPPDSLPSIYNSPLLVEVAGPKSTSPSSNASGACPDALLHNKTENSQSHENQELTFVCL